MGGTRIFLSVPFNRRGVPVLLSSLRVHLDSLQQVRVLLELGVAELNAVLQMESHKSGVESDNNLPLPASYVRAHCAFVSLLCSFPRFLLLDTILVVTYSIPDKHQEQPSTLNFLTVTAQEYNWNYFRHTGVFLQKVLLCSFRGLDQDYRLKNKSRWFLCSIL